MEVGDIGDVKDGVHVRTNLAPAQPEALGSEHPNATVFQSVEQPADVIGWHENQAADALNRKTHSAREFLYRSHGALHSAFEAADV
ncbi:MAG: hypothetical protein QOC92_98 [Acidimicrobiaceae bacterium]